MTKDNKIILINPPLAIQKSDPITTGIVYMPIGLAYLAAKLIRLGIKVNVIDAFGEGINQISREEKYYIHGISALEIADRIKEDTSLIVIYANTLINHGVIANIIRTIKEKYKEIKIAVMENSQAVAAYSLEIAGGYFLDIGADYLILGDSEDAIPKLLEMLDKHEDDIPKIVRGKIEDLDCLHFPDWKLFPLSNYWELGYSHGPIETDRYLPILTSRGCPYSCNFCVAPYNNQSGWKARSANNVVREMKEFSGLFNVREFHLVDLNPTVSEERVIQICHEIKEARLDIVWKLVSGTKAETIKNMETLDIMKDSGCNYISISPETGSDRLLKIMNKSFDQKHGIKLIKAMKRLKISSQACFVLGFPGEQINDLKETYKMLKDIVRAGIDEIVFFIITPVPGSAIFKEFNEFHSLNELTFSPTWRKDFNYLNRHRIFLYSYFLFLKLFYQPLSFLINGINIIRRRFKTKMEMTFFRMFKFKLILFKNG